RRDVIDVRRQRPRAQRISILPVDALGEVHVAPPTPDVAEQLVLADTLARVHNRTDVPVAEAAAALARDGDIRRMRSDPAPFDGVDRRAVLGGDVDPEMERGERPLGAEVEAGIVERATDRV